LYDEDRVSGISVGDQIRKWTVGREKEEYLPEYLTKLGHDQNKTDQKDGNLETMVEQVPSLQR
jgi:hypothetical protein